MNRIAMIASIIWLLAIGAYAVGFFASGETGNRALPTLDILFFALATAGPLAMLWIVVSLTSRISSLSDTMSAQADSALALATTVATLNDSIDQLSDGTRGRLADACVQMEHHALTTADTFERHLAETGSRLNRVMLESIVLIDEKIALRIEAFEAALERQRASLDQHLREDTVRMSEALEAQRAALDRRVNEDTARLSATIEAELSSLAQFRATLMDDIRTGLVESRSRVDRGVADILAHQQAGVLDANQRLDSALETFTATLSTLQGQHSQMLDTDVAGPVNRLQATVEETRKALAAHPPASADALADLLGKTAQIIVRDDRKAAEGVLLRLETLEQKADRMLNEIDRTSRLNPLMDRSRVEPERMNDEDAGDELPFAALPRSAARLPMNWTAALRALAGGTALNDAAPAVAKAAADPDIARLLGLTEALAGALREDKVHLEDLTPEHAPATYWHRYARGERGGELAQIGDVADEITQALVRARLRGDAEFRALAIRQADAYGRLIQRAGQDLGADPKLVEMAETLPGRAFLLLGGLVGAFDLVSPVDLPQDAAGS